MHRLRVLEGTKVWGVRGPRTMKGGLVEGGGKGLVKGGPEFRKKENSHWAGLSNNEGGKSKLQMTVIGIITQAIRIRSREGKRTLSAENRVTSKL